MSIARRPGAIAQRELADRIDSGPRVASQRRIAEAIQRSPRVTTQQAFSRNVQREVTSRRNDTGLPDNLKAGVESLSGVSLEGVKVHYNSGKPAQLNALAAHRNAHAPILLQPLEEVAESFRCGRSARGSSR